MNDVSQRTSKIKTCLISAKMSGLFNKKTFRVPYLAADNGLNAWVNLEMKRNIRDGWGIKKLKIKHVFILLVLCRT